MPRSLSTSRRQLETNRLNAAKSTGPRTEEGKERSRANALKHGLTAEIVLFPGEDPVTAERVGEALRSYYCPATEWEEQFISEAVSIMIRLKRVPTFEAALFQWMRQQQIDNERSTVFPLEIAMPGFYDDDDVEEVEADADELQTGKTFAALLDQNLLSKLTRYETTLQGRLNTTLRQLDDLKARRLRDDRVD